MLKFEENSIKSWSCIRW